MKQIRQRLTYANVMSSIAVFFILGGATAFAATKIGANEIKANSIKTGKIVKEAVTAGKIKNGAVTNGKLGAASVSTDKIADLAVTNPKIAELAVTSNKLANGAVTGSKLAPGAVSRANIEGAGLIPRGFARVDSDGTVQSNLTIGIPNATTPVTGTYCFDLPFTPVHAQATGEADGEGNDMASVNLANSEEGLVECPAGTDVEVEMWDTGSDAATTEQFYLVVW